MNRDFFKYSFNLDNFFARSLISIILFTSELPNPRSENETKFVAPIISKNIARSSSFKYLKDIPDITILTPSPVNLDNKEANALEYIYLASITPHPFRIYY